MERAGADTITRLFGGLSMIFWHNKSGFMRPVHTQRKEGNMAKIVENLTPESMRCKPITPMCPSIHRLDDGRIRIVGAMESPQGDDVGAGECAIIVDPHLLSLLKD